MTRSHCKIGGATCLTLTPIPRNTVGVAHLIAAEQVERAAYSEVNLAAAQVLYGLQIVERMHSASIGHWNTCVLAEEFNQPGVNSFTFPFHIRSMNQKLITTITQLTESSRL